MKYVKESRTFTTDEFSTQEIITEIGDCLAVLRTEVFALTPFGARQPRALLSTIDEIEKILLVELGKKIDKMLPFVPVEVQEKEKL